uniref:S1-like domain-containing protein n=1 Tax=viral metagenome TaxID=1070528 RepID=A0A6C0F3M3_9ZZZZ
MVKNTTGGSGHKKFARKNETSKKGRNLRISLEDAEIYGIVTKMFGNKFNAICADGKERGVMIRGKFSGKGKRDNFVAVGTWVLIGSRAEWSTELDKNGMEVCDLLEVYTAQNREELKRTVPIDWSHLVANDLSVAVGQDGATDDSLVFESGSSNDELKKIIESDIGKKTVGFMPSAEVEEEKEIDIDDI